ncbi:MAG: DUF1963 domain-containing protein [Isosphaeraceae bacterium]
MAGRVAELKRFHGTKSFGSRANLILREDEAAGLYHALEPQEARELASFAIGLDLPTEGEDKGEILRCLACLRPGSLDDFHLDLVGRGILYPPMIWYGAGADIAARIVGMLPGPDTLRTNHLLLALAWIGDGVVQDAFDRWRNEPPEWVAMLYVPPHRYAEEAGWELMDKGSRRDLFARRCHPLVVPEEGASNARIATVVAEHEEACRWCGRSLTTLIDLDLTAPALSFLSLDGRRLRIATCEVCSCFGAVFTKVGPDGGSTWYEGNQKPEYLPDDADDWPRMPAGRLVIGDEPRHWLEAADWLVPGVRFSQVGGLPTRVQDAEYPRCPECDHAMPFVAQISNDDLDESSEGIYYMFACRGCGVAATSYQQS